MLQRSTGNKSTFKKFEPNPRECGVVWNRTTKDGSKTFLSGKLTITKQFLDKLANAEVDKNGNKIISFAAFANDNKATDKSPDYRIILDKDEF